MIPFNYHHLYYFYVIAQEGSISRATEVLHLAQPTLSAQLKQFEGFLNVKLFVRENRKLILTEEGRQVFSYARAIFDIGRELKDRMVDLSHKGRTHLQVGTSPFVPQTVVEVLLDFLLKADPSVHLSLFKDNMPQLMENLESHSLDMVLTDTPFEAPVGEGIQNCFVGKIPIVFCAHPDLARKIRRFPQDLTGQPLILPASSRQISYRIKEYLYENHVTPTIVGEIQDIETVRRLALRGYGVAPLNLLTVREAPTRQKLVILKMPGRNPIYEKVYLVTKKRTMKNPLVERTLSEFRIDDFIGKA